MKFKVQNPHSKFYPAGRSYVSTQEEGSYRGQTGKSRPPQAGSEEEEDGSEKEGKQQLGKLSPPLESWVMEPDFRRAVPCSCLPGCRAERASGNREMTLNNAESRTRKSPSLSPTPADYSHLLTLMEKSLFPAFPASLTPL